MEVTNIYRGTLDDGEFPNIVYKYRTWNSDFHKNFIIKREVFLASPKSFEDEFDCKIPLRHDLLSVSQIHEYAMHWSKVGRPDWSRQQHRKEARKFVKEKLFKNQQYLNEFREKYFTGLNERLGILSLTAEPCNPEMWKKYAEDSKGICIGYNSRIMFEHLGGGGAVHYVDELPIIFPEPIMSHPQMRATQVYSKLRKWDFEKEYRTMGFWENPASDQQRKIILPPEAFNCVILGENISSENRTEITEFVNVNIGNIPIFEHHNVC